MSAKKQKTVKVVVDELIPWFTFLIKKELPFQKKHKMSIFIKSLKEIQESYSQERESIMLKNAETNDDGSVKSITDKENSNFGQVIWKKDCHPIFINENKKLIESLVEIDGYMISAADIETAFTSKDESKKEQNAKELGELLIAISDFIID